MVVPVLPAESTTGGAVDPGPGGAHSEYCGAAAPPPDFSPTGVVGGGAMLYLALVCPYFACKRGSLEEEWKPSGWNFIIGFLAAPSSKTLCVTYACPPMLLYPACGDRAPTIPGVAGPGGVLRTAGDDGNDGCCCCCCW